jgi:predicted GIY-YIG superfamily endonuclease
MHEEKNAIVYHIRYKSDHNNIDKGYIGVTSSFDRRKAQHFGTLSRNCHTNYKLQNAFNESCEDLEFVIYKEFDNVRDAYLLEETLRPYKNIALNIAVGGEREFVNRFETKGYNFENDLINISKMEQLFLISPSKFSTINKIIRVIFKHFINNWVLSGQSMILNNILKIHNLNNLVPMSKRIMLEAWQCKTDVFLGNWGAIPHDITSVAFALTNLTKSVDDKTLKLKYLSVLIYVLSEIENNKTLYRFNQVDGVLLDIIFTDFFIEKQKFEGIVSEIDQLYR